MTTGMPIALSCSVRYSEFVSLNRGVSSSEPIAMISAERLIFLSKTPCLPSRQRLSHDAKPDTIQRSGIHDHQVFVQVKSQSHKTQPRNHQFGLLWIAESKNAAPSPIRCDDIEM